MTGIVISGTGLFDPPYKISNEELVESYNAYVDNFNRQHEKEITAGAMQPLQHSSSEFILKASGIKSRHVVNRDGVLDPNIMAPRLRERSNDELSLSAEMAVNAARQAMEAAGKKPEDFDGVLLSCSGIERGFPAVSIEIQEALGIEGFAFDMNVACSSATFGIKTASDMIRSGNARAILMVNPEICSGQLDYRDRDSHFIFGDVATAVVLEKKDTAMADHVFEIVSTKLKTKFSNNIRSNYGFLNRATPETIGAPDKLFKQEGRKVFKEVVPMVADMILEHMNDNKVTPDDIARLWLHQANINMNDFISKKVLGRDPAPGQAPVILDEYANTSSAGSIVAFHKYKNDLKSGDLGVICSFGAGYSIGSVIVRKV